MACRTARSNSGRVAPPAGQLPCLPRRVEFSRIIEIGGGNGKFLNRLQEVNSSPLYIGVDINKEIIERARKTYPQIQFVSGDIFDFLNSETDLKHTIVASRWTLVFFTEGQMRELLTLIKDKDGAVYFAETFYHSLGSGIASKYSGATKNSYDYIEMANQSGMMILKQDCSQPTDTGGLLRLLAKLKILLPAIGVDEPLERLDVQ
jgi:predicted TPR repeat methyltransferase